MEELSVKGYIDASFQIDKDDSRSHSEFVFLMNDEVVTWRISKHDTVTNLIIESEYIEVTEEAKGDIWMKKLISGLNVVSIIDDPIKIFCNNEGAVALTREFISYKH